MIPIRKLDEELFQIVGLVERGTTIFELVAAYFISVLHKNNGNRTHTSIELKIPIRTVRNRIWELIALGYEIPEPPTGRPEQIKAMKYREGCARKRKTKKTEF